MKRFIFAVSVIAFFVNCSGTGDNLYEEKGIIIHNVSGHDILVGSFRFETDTILPFRYYRHLTDNCDELGTIEDTDYIDPLQDIIPDNGCEGVFAFYEPRKSNLFRALPDQTLHVFIFHGDTIRAHSWDEIREDYNIIVRYDIRYEDLKPFKGPCPVIPFPPSEAMKDMKMWPPYKEVVKKYKNQESL